MRFFEYISIFMFLGFSCVGVEEGAFDNLDSTSTRESDQASGASEGQVSYPPLEFDGLTQAQAISHDKIRLEFSPAKGGSGLYQYQVFLNNDLATPHQSFSQITSLSSTTSEIVTTGLSVGTNYSVILRVRDAVTTKNDGNIKSLSVTTMLQMVPDFEGLGLIQRLSGILGESTLKLSWSAAQATANPLQGYRVYAKKASESFNWNAPTLTLPDATSTSTVLTGLESGVSYDVVVRAYDTLGNEDKNTVMKSLSTSISGPVKFDGLASFSPPYSPLGYTELELFWVKATGSFHEYRIYVSTSPLTSINPLDPPQFTLTNADLQNYRLTGLSPNTTYYASVVAINTDTNEFDGESVIMQTTTSPGLPFFSGLQSATSPNGVDALTAVKLTWAPAQGPFNRYAIYQRLNTGIYGATPTKVVDASSLETIMTGLTTDSTYCFRARAQYSQGATVLGEDSNLVEQCLTPRYEEPSFTGILSCETLNSHQIRLSWNQATGVFDQYQVFREQGLTVSPATLNSAPLVSVAQGVNSQVIGSLTPNTNYSFVTRTFYSSLSSGDKNTQVRTCKTDPVFLSVKELFPGNITSGNVLLGTTRICVQDSNGDPVTTYTLPITLREINDDLNFFDSDATTRPVTRTPVAGCVNFDNLVYTGAFTSLQFEVSTPGAQSLMTSTITLIDEGAPPEGACALSSASWFSAFGGCYNTTTGLVLSANKFAGTSVGRFYEASSVESTSIKLIDYDETGLGSGTDFIRDSDGDGLPDEFDPVSPYHWSYHRSENNAYCRNLVEGGYDDWRTMNLSEFYSLRAENASTYVPNPSSTSLLPIRHNSGNWAYYVRFTSTGPIHGVQGTDSNHQCVRNAEVSYSKPSFFGDEGVSALSVPSGARGASEIDVTWNTPTSGSYNGYQLYWAASPTAIDYTVSCARPFQEAICTSGTCCKQVRKNRNSFTLQNLIPGTQYSVGLRAVWDNAHPARTDGNTHQLSATTRSAKYHLYAFEGWRLANTGYLPLWVEVREVSSGELVLTSGITATVNKISGAGTLTGNMVLVQDGIAKFTTLNYTDNDSLTIRVSGGAIQDSDDLTKTVRPVHAFGCKDFSKEVYPYQGGCYFSTANLIMSSLDGTLHGHQGGCRNTIWQAGAGNQYAESWDDQDANNNGLYDHIDSRTYANLSTTTDNTIYASSTNTLEYCHALNDGGYSDWRRPSVYEALLLRNGGSLNPVNFLNRNGTFNAGSTQTNIRTSTLSSNNGRSFHVYIDTGVVSEMTDCNWARYVTHICVRTL